MPTGVRHFQGADVVLCAANGIGTAAPAPAVGPPGRPRRPRQLVGARRPPAHGAPGRDGRGLLRRRPAQLAGALRRADPVARVRRHRPRPRVRGRHPVEPHAHGRTARGRVRLARPSAARRRPPPPHAQPLRPGRALGRAVRGPPRPAEPGGALGHAGGRRRHPRTQGHLPHQRRRTPGHGVEHRARHASRSPKPARTRSRRWRCATTATCSAPRGWATSATRRSSTGGASPTTCATSRSSTAACS